MLLPSGIAYIEHTRPPGDTPLYHPARRSSTKDSRSPRPDARLQPWGGYHEAFWLATAAVAPLITLAVVVAVPDVAVAAYGWKENQALAEVDAMFSEPGKYTSSQEQEIRTRAGHEIRTRASLREDAVRLWWVTLSNLVVQAGLLAVSLVALATRTDIMPSWIPIVLAVGGILLLALMLLYGSGINQAQRLLDRKEPRVLGLQFGMVVVDPLDPLALGDRNPPNPEQL